MNTIWLKIAGGAVAAVVALVAVGIFMSDSEPASEPEPKPRVERKEEVTGIRDQWEKDEEKLRAEPQPVEQSTTPSTPVPSNNSATQNTTPQPVEAVEPATPTFEELPFEEDIEAQRQWEWVVNQRKMGRLPVTTYGQMVRTCREIIRRWPKSKYAFMAKRAMGELPERYHTMYNITPEEIDLGGFQ